MKKQHGTRGFTGLNVGSADHLIEPHELTESENGWTDEMFMWKTAPGPVRKYSGYSNIVALAAGRSAGEDRVVYADSTLNKLYDNGDEVALPTGMTIVSGCRIIALDDGFLILGDTLNYIYDGVVVREWGAWQGDETPHSPNAAVNAKAALATVSSATAASPVVITPSADTGLSDGDEIVITGHSPSGLNGTWTVDNVDASSPYTFEVNCDGSGWDAGGSGGSIYSSSGHSGDYLFYLVPVLELHSGRVLVGTPVGMTDSSLKDISEAAELFSLSADDEWSFRYGLTWESVSGQALPITGTIGTDYTPGLRLYRTKAGGSDFYLEDEWWYGDDATLTGAGFLWANEANRYYSRVPDIDLGAVYLPSLTSHSTPARAALACSAGHRVFFVPYGKENELHWTGLDGVEYSGPSDFIPVPDSINAIYGYRDRVVIWSADRMWIFDLTGGIPDLKEVITPVGTTFPDAIARTDDGVYFLREDGLWLFDGLRARCVSRKAFSSISEPKTVCAAGDTIYMSGESDSYVVRIRDNGWNWHKLLDPLPYADDTSGKIYASDGRRVYEMFAGSSRGGKMTTKRFDNDGQEWTVTKVFVMVKGASSFEITINGDAEGDYQSHQEPAGATGDERRLAEVSIPRWVNPGFTVTVETSGDLEVHGIWPEVTK